MALVTLKHCLFLFSALVLFSISSLSQDTSIVWKQVNNSNYSFKYPEHWDLKFEEDSKDGFTLEIYERSVRKAIGTIKFTGQKMWQKQSPDEIIESQLVGYKDSVNIFYPIGSGGTFYDTADGLISATEFLGPQTDEEPLYTVRLIQFGWQGTGLSRCYYYETRVEPGSDPKVTESGGITCLWFMEMRTYQLTFSADEEVFEKYKPLVDSIIESTSVKK